MLAIALVLLALVGGLALWQRGMTRQPMSQHRVPASPRPASAREVGGARQVLPRREDPELGAISYDGDMWVREEELAFAGTTVLLEISADVSGPDAAAKAIVRSALSQGRDLDSRARAVILSELARRGVAGKDLDPYELAVGPDDEGRLSGFLWYSVPDLPGEFGVSSLDHWCTLHLEVME